MNSGQEGVTLIELMIALLIISVSVIALGSFSISSLETSHQAGQRLEATHIAEQIIEFWQHDANDRPPIIASDCSLATATSQFTFPNITSCAPPSNKGTAVDLTITIDSVNLSAPITSNGVISSSNFTQQPGYTISPLGKSVVITWVREGQTEEIKLTHVSEVK